MKEIIYLDTEIINSLLAQLDEGLVSSFILESSNQETQGEESQTSFSKNAGLKAGMKLSTGILPGGSVNFGLNSGDEGIESEKVNSSILEGQKDILNKAFHDYSLNLLLENLTSNNLINSDQNFFEGNMYSIECDYKLYDFELIKRASDTKLLSEFFMISNNKTDLTLEEAELIIKNKKSPADELAKANQVIATKRLNRSHVHNYRKSEIFGILGDNLLGDTVIIKANNILALANKDLLRISSTNLALSNPSRKANILFRVISKKDHLFVEENVRSIQSDHFRLLPTVMLDIILSSLNIIEQGDVLVTPIAIYYEEN